MTSRSRAGHLPVRYRLRVAEYLDQRWSTWFGDLVLDHEGDGTTTLTGPVADQADLHGLLAKIRDLGLTLVGVAVIDAPSTTGPQPATGSTQSGVEDRPRSPGH